VLRGDELEIELLNEFLDMDRSAATYEDDLVAFLRKNFAGTQMRSWRSAVWHSNFCCSDGISSSPASGRALNTRKSSPVNCRTFSGR